MILQPVVLKIDKDAKMDVVTEVRQAQRRDSALKISFSDANVDKITFQRRPFSVHWYKNLIRPGMPHKMMTEINKTKSISCNFYSSDKI